MKTLLIVEPEELVRNLVRRLMELEGYRVLEARHPDEAIRICEGPEHKVQLVITEVVMPKMTGRKLVRRLASITPDVKVLYMSSVREKELLQHGLLDEGAPFLQKPFKAEIMEKKVRKLLEANRKNPG